jgi:hypothetical protein
VTIDNDENVTIPFFMMTDTPYSEILDRLDKLDGSPYEIDKYDFLELGITTAHIPNLIETILDDKYYFDESTEASIAHLFAYVALGQLKTDAAIDGLMLGVRKWSNSNWFEWFTEGMPDIFAKIGISAVPRLIRELQDTSQIVDVRMTSIQYLESIAQKYPEVRDRCVEVMVAELEKFADNDPELNGGLVGSLVYEFKAIEAVSLIEAAYTANRVDPAFPGNWDNVQVELGLKKAPKIPTRQREIQRKLLKSLERDLAREQQQLDTKSRENIDKDKNKRKQQKAARRKNRSK